MTEISFLMYFSSFLCDHSLGERARNFFVAKLDGRVQHLYFCAK